MAGNNYAEPTPCREPDFNQAFYRLTDALCSIEATIDELEKRLAPALNQASKAQAETAARPPGSCVISESTYGAANRVSFARARIGELLDRLEI